jgi:hypothetical protein
MLLSLLLAISGFFDSLEGPLRGLLSLIGLSGQTLIMALAVIYTVMILFAVIKLRRWPVRIAITVLAVLEVHVLIEALLLPGLKAEAIASAGDAVCHEVELAALPWREENNAIIVEGSAGATLVRLLLDPSATTSLRDGLPRDIALAGFSLASVGISPAMMADAPSGIDGRLGGDALTRFEVEMDSGTHSLTLSQFRDCPDFTAYPTAYTAPAWSRGARRANVTFTTAQQMMLAVPVNNGTLQLLLDGGKGVTLSPDAARAAGGKLSIGGQDLPPAVKAAANQGDGSIGLLALGARHLLIVPATGQIFLSP